MEDVTQEEIFVYHLSRGKSKSEAYRLIRDCKDLNKGSIAVLAHRYSMQPHVLKLINQMDDNTFMNYLQKREDVINNLYDIALNGSSERAKIDASQTLLTHTAKIAKLTDKQYVDTTNVSSVLEDLRSMLLSPLQTSSEGRKAPCNSVPNFEKFSNDNVIDVKVCKEGKYYFDGEIVDEGKKDVVEEQIEGINPLAPKKGVKGVTGQFRDSDGKFVKFSKVREDIGF